MSSYLINTLNELNCPLVGKINFDNISLMDFSRILNWISLQLHISLQTECIINIIKDESDLISLQIEVNSLLNELGSIHANSCSLKDVSKRQLILYSVTGDLLAARLNFIKKFNENCDVFSNKLNPKNDIKIINNCLSVCSDLQNIKSYFQTVKQNLDKNLLKYHEEDSLLLPNDKKLTLPQWNELKKLNEKLTNDFSLRREVLLRRADMTVNSFSWNQDKTRETDEQTIKNIYNEHRKLWSNVPNVTLSHALASRSSDCDSLINKRISINHASCFIEAPSIGKANTGLQQRLQLHKFLIGTVPDRGGRPFEQIPPPKETFAQQQSQRDNRNRGYDSGNRSNNYRRHSEQNQQYYQDNYNQQNKFPENFGSRIQNAGWQQQQQGGYHHKDYYNDHQHNRNENYRRNHIRGGHYYQRGGRGGNCRGK